MLSFPDICRCTQCTVSLAPTNTYLYSAIKSSFWLANSGKRQYVPDPRIPFRVPRLSSLGKARSDGVIMKYSKTEDNFTSIPLATSSVSTFRIPLPHSYQPQAIEGLWLDVLNFLKTLGRLWAWERSYSNIPPWSSKCPVACYHCLQPRPTAWRIYWACDELR